MSDVVQDDAENTSLRRSSRKRKTTMKNDSDYDYYDLKDFSSPLEAFPIKKIAKSKRTRPRPMNPKQKAVKKPENEALVQKPKPVKVYEENPEKPTNCSGSEEQIQKIPQFFKYPKNEISCQKMNLKKMSSNEIIDAHSENLERRLENVAFDFLENWNTSPVQLVMPRPFLGGNPELYSNSEPDVVAVKKVLENMLKVVSILNK